MIVVRSFATGVFDRPGGGCIVTCSCGAAGSTAFGSSGCTAERTGDGSGILGVSAILTGFGAGGCWGDGSTVAGCEGAAEGDVDEGVLESADVVAGGTALEVGSGPGGGGNGAMPTPLRSLAAAAAAAEAYFKG